VINVDTNDQNEITSFFHLEYVNITKNSGKSGTFDIEEISLVLEVDNKRHINGIVSVL
jgi:hypothetical protein